MWVRVRKIYVVESDGRLVQSGRDLERSDLEHVSERPWNNLKKLVLLRSYYSNALELLYQVNRFCVESFKFFFFKKQKSTLLFLYPIKY